MWCEYSPHDLGYHATHDYPRYHACFDMERVTPFHEQLAIPAFLTLATGFAIALTAWIRSRTRSVATA
jgi:hypothetical protein